MSKIRFLQLLFIFYLLGSCTQETWNVEQENVLRQGVLTRGVGPMEDAMEGLKGTTLGKKLIESLSIPVKFEYDQSMKPGTMGYVGRGVIRYNDLGDPFGPLLFHELVHVYQMKEIAVASRNHEVEAYMAQYLLVMSIEGAEEKDFYAVSTKFVDYIRKLAKYTTWSVMDTKGSIKFQRLYEKALVELRKHHLYGTNTNYTEEPGPYSFQNLYNFLSIK